MPWGTWKSQVLGVSGGGVETASAVDDVLEELGELTRFGAEAGSVRWVAEVRYSQSKSALVKRLSQKIRLVVELVPGLDEDSCYISVGAQGGDVSATGSAKGVELFKTALARRVTFLPLDYEMSATEFVSRLKFGVEMQVISEMVEKHGHEYVQENDPEGYAIWVQAMKEKGEL